MQTATERMNFHQPEKSLPNRPFGRKVQEVQEVQEVDSKLPEQEESKVERKPKRKAKSK